MFREITVEISNNANFTFNISEILKLETIQQITKLEPFIWEKQQIENWKNLHTDFQLEEKLAEFKERNFTKKLHQ